MNKMVWTYVVSLSEPFVEIPTGEFELLGGGQVAVSWVVHSYEF